MRRILILLIELVAEALLLGCLLGFFASNQIGFLYGVIGSTLAVPVILFLHGYYLTRCFDRPCLAGVTPWLYPAITMALFVGHMHFAIARSRSDLSPFAQATELPFLAGGACIAFACAFVVDRILRRWTRTSSSPPVVLSTDPPAIT